MRTLIYRYVIQFVYLWIIVKENSLSKAEYCPCTIKPEVQEANCSHKHLFDIPRCVPSATKKLVLSNNRIVYQLRQFHRFTSLIHLDLFGNNRFTPSKDSFEELTHLQILNLGFTNIHKIQTGTFANLSNLVHLTLRGNFFETLPADLFINVNKLTELYLGNNQIDGFEIRNYQFSNLINLWYLNLELNRNLVLNDHSLSGLVNLRYLTLALCDLKTLSLDIFSQLHQLTLLILSANELSQISNYTFVNLSRLEYLALDANDIGQISNYTFLNFSHLLHLDLRENRNLILNTHSFVGLQNLKNLSLANTKICHLSSCTPEMFQPLVQLEILHLEGVCALKDYHYYCDKIDELLGALPSLKNLYLDNLIINSLGRGFRSMQALEELNFVLATRYHPFWHRCIVHSLNNETFRNLRNLSIKKISIEDCRINEIVPYAFSYFTNLNELELTGIKGDSLCNKKSYNIETGLQNTKIKTFLLKCNCNFGQSMNISGITGIEKSQLEFLDISNCPIQYIDEDLFSSLPISLNSINLKQNCINHISKLSDLYRLQSLQVLNLSNQKEFLRGRIITSPKAYTKDLLSQDSKASLNVYKQNSQSIPMNLAKNNESFYHFQKPEHRFKNIQSRHYPCRKLPPAFSTIDISHSGLLCDVVDLLCDTTNSVKTLDIAYQRVTTCFESVWKVTQRLLKLEHLNANGNHIKIIPPDAFSQLGNLKILSLRENILAVISFDLKTLVFKKLDVSDNNIMYLSNKMTQTLSKIAQRSKLNIYLRGNSLVCDCERVAFVAWLRYTKSIYQKDKLTCKVRNTNYNISNIDKLYEKLQYECTAPEVVSSCIAGFVFLNLVLVIMALMRYRRWKIRYLRAIGRKNVRPYHPIEDCEVELEYDVYISYERDYKVTNNETLHELVTQKLYPGLQRRGFRVFTREEINPGMGLYNAISWSLRRCSKFVSLISKNYCKDQWNVFEFNIAVLEGIITKRQVIIPIALENLQREDLNAEMYAYLSSEPVSYYSCNVSESTFLGFLTEKIRDNTILD